MTQRVNPERTLEAQGITGLGRVYYNLIEMAIDAEINGKLVHQRGDGAAQATDSAVSETAADDDLVGDEA